jgi:hypothetical protein
MDFLSSFFASHPEFVTAVIGGLIVHLRTAIPSGKPGTALGLFTGLWDILAGNYGTAKNAPVQDTQDTPVNNALDV